MTRLILNPSNLQKYHHDATPTSPKRVKLLVQLLNFNWQKSTITIQQIPATGQSHDITTSSSSAAMMMMMMDISVVDLLADDNMVMALKRGNLLSIEAMYDGVHLLPFRIVDVTGDAVAVLQRWDCLEYMSSIEPFASPPM